MAGNPRGSKVKPVPNMGMASRLFDRLYSRQTKAPKRSPLWFRFRVRIGRLVHHARQ